MSMSAQELKASIAIASPGTLNDPRAATGVLLEAAIDQKFSAAVQQQQLMGDIELLLLPSILTQPCTGFEFSMKPSAVASVIASSRDKYPLLHTVSMHNTVTSAPSPKMLMRPVQGSCFLFIGEWGRGAKSFADVSRMAIGG